MDETELDVLELVQKERRFKVDRVALGRIEEGFTDYAMTIFSAESKEELDDVAKEIEPFYRLLNAWNKFPVDYRYFKSSIDKLRSLKKALEERYHEIGNGKPARVHEKEERNLEAVVSRRVAEKTPEKNTQKIAQILPPQKNPTLSDLLDFYKSKGLVGEEKTAILQTLGAVHGLCFGIESLSGSGKTYALDILLELLPEDYVYVLKQSSDKALMYDSEKINAAKVIVATELQKSANNKTVIEILKDLGEGKSAERAVTKVDRTGVVHQKIDGGKSVIYTLALENWFKKDRELERRYFQLFTDISEEQTKKILEAAAAREFGAGQSSLSGKESGALKAHLYHCMNLSGVQYVNPFAGSIIENIPLMIKSRSFVNHYFDLVNASTRFHYGERLRSGDLLFADIDDAYCINRLYGEQFIKSVLRIPIAGDELMAAFQEGYITAAEVHRNLKREKSPLTYPVVEDMLEELAEAGYLEKDSQNSREPQYRKIAEISSIKKDVDWQQCFINGVDVMEQNYPEIAEMWISRQLKEGEVAVFDPLRREDVLLAVR